MGHFASNSAEYLTGKAAHAAAYTSARATGKTNDEARAAADILATKAQKNVSKKIQNSLGWKKPSFAKFENCKPLDPTIPEGDRICKNIHKKRISRGYEMMNFQREKKKNGNNILNFESRKRRYWRLSNLGPNRKSVKNPNYNPNNPNNQKNPQYIPFQLSTYTDYIANDAPALFGFSEERYINHRNNAFKLKQFQEALEAKKSGNMAQGIDLEKYQQLLQDPKTKKQAAEELQVFKQMLIDGRTMNREQLAATIKNVKMAETIASTLGMLLGTFSGTGIATAAFEKTLSYSGQAVGAVSALASAGVEANSAHRLRAITSALKTGLGIGTKIAVGAVVGTVLGLSGAGFPCVVLAAVSAAGAVAAHQYGKHLKTKKLATEVNAEELIELITQMIQNDGVIEETNPMFSSQKRVKNILNDSIIGRLNKGENINTIISSINVTNEVNTNNIKDAQTLLAQMKNARTHGLTYSKNTKQWSQAQGDKITVGTKKNMFGKPIGGRKRRN